MEQIPDHMQIENKHIKRCSTSLAIKEIPVKTMMRYHCTNLRTCEFIFLMTILNAGEDSKKLDHLYTLTVRNLYTPIHPVWKKPCQFL